MHTKAVACAITRIGVPLFFRSVDYLLDLPPIQTPIEDAFSLPKYACYVFNPYIAIGDEVGAFAN